MNKERKISIGLIFLLIFFFVLRTLNGGYSFGVNIVTTFFVSILMVIYIGLAENKIRKWLINKVEQHRFLTPILSLLFLLVIESLYSALVGHFNLTDIFYMALFLLIPLTFILLERRRNNKLTLWIVLAIVSIWFLSASHILPQIEIPLKNGITFTNLFGIIWLMYLFLVVRKLEDIGFTYNLNAHDWKTAALYFSIFMAFFALPLGITTKFLSTTKHMMAIYKWPVVAVATMFFIAIVEEFLFRGLILNLLRKTIRGKHSVFLSLLFSSLIFGFAHTGHSKLPVIVMTIPVIGKIVFPWVYILLATIAGWFYGLTYLKTGKITAAALTHCLVDTAWVLFLKG